VGEHRPKDPFASALAIVCKCWSILCKIRDGWLRAGRVAGLSNNGNPSSVIMGIIIVIDQLCIL
jgi:hypothetical protein